MAQGKTPGAALVPVFLLFLIGFGCQVPFLSKPAGTPTPYETAGPGENTFRKAYTGTPTAEEKEATVTPGRQPTPIGSTEESGSGLPTLVVTPTEIFAVPGLPTAIIGEVTPTVPAGTPAAVPTAIIGGAFTPTVPAGTPTAIPTPAPYLSSTPITPQPTTTPRPTVNPGKCQALPNTDLEQKLVTLIKQMREAQGKPALNRKDKLDAAARQHSQDMACNNFYSPTGSDGSDAAQRVEATGYQSSITVGQILYAGSGNKNSPEAAIEKWKTQANAQGVILSANYVDIGVGYYSMTGGQYEGYITVVFATPK